MQVKRTELLKALDALRPGLGKKGIVEQMNHFGFTGEEIVTYNDFISIIYPFKTDFECSVPADELYKIIDNLSSDDLKMELKDEKLMLKAGKSKASIRIQDGEHILQGIKDSGFHDIKKWKGVPDDFKEGLNLCLFSVSKDMTDLRLTAIFVDHEALMSVDQLRCSRYIFRENKKGIDEIAGNFFIPGSSVQELLKFDGIQEFAKNDRWVFFKNKDGVIFASKLLDFDDYPDVDELLDFEGIKLDLPEKVKEAIGLALVMADGETEAERLIDVEIDAKSIRCKGENEIGWVSHELDVDFDIDRTIGFEINPGFFLTILNHTRNMIYIDGRAKFETPDFAHAVCIK